MLFNDLIGIFGSFKPENGGRGVTKLVVILTDGYSSSHSETILQATQLHHTGVKVIKASMLSFLSTRDSSADPETFVRGGPTLTTFFLR